MNKAERKKVEKLIDAFEWHEYCFSGLRKINGGYATAKLGEVNDEEIEIHLELGTQDMGDGHSECDRGTYYIDREVALSDIDVAEKLKKIRDWSET